MWMQGGVSALGRRSRRARMRERERERERDRARARVREAGRADLWRCHRAQRLRGAAEPGGGALVPR
jgi:hypothetical protein